MKIYFRIVIFILPIILNADGPPIDQEGNVKGDHVVIYINKDQIKQVSISHIITFTNPQQEFLKKVNSNFPNKLYVVNQFYNDCTCDLIYCIWFRENKIAIPCFMFDNINDQELLQANKEAISMNMIGEKTIYIDNSGDLFYKKKSLQLF